MLTWRHHKTNCLLGLKLQLQFASQDARTPEMAAVVAQQETAQSFHGDDIRCQHFTAYLLLVAGQL